MIPHFGAGLRNYLFNNRSGTIRADITQRIEEQVAEYLPYLAIENIEFFMPEDDFATEQATTQMGIQISYSVSNFNFSDMLKIEKINFI